MRWTNSAEIVEQAERGAAAPFTVHFLRMDRSRYNTTTPSERRGTDRMQDLLEALADLLFLVRSDLLAGSMFSNFPRLALALRVMAPGSPYVSTDGREWCTRTSCKMDSAVHSNTYARTAKQATVYDYPAV